MSIAVVQKTTKMKSIKLNVIDKETAKQLADILHMKIHWIDDTSFVLNLEDDAQNGLLFNISTGCYDLYPNNSKYTYIVHGSTLIMELMIATCSIMFRLIVAYLDLVCLMK